MAESELPKGYQPSLLDRLIDAEAAGTADRRGFSEQHYIAAVRRDLQDLLNTRRPTYGEFGIENLEHVQRSVVGYGLPDFANLRGLSEDMRRQIGNEIADAILTFEPRLTDVTVSVKDPDEVKAALKDEFQLTAVYFHIEAKLRMDPCPPVAFETVLELAGGRHRIEGAEVIDE